jgi:hypothetical protein
MSKISNIKYLRVQEYFIPANKEATTNVMEVTDISLEQGAPDIFRTLLFFFEFWLLLLLFEGDICALTLFTLLNLYLLLICMHIYSQHRHD